MAQMQVFVSHSSEDDTFCRGVVTALRGAGADVWYDEHNLDAGQLMDTIERELRARPVVVVILSVAALRSQWVRDECRWAYTMLRRDPSRIILPVTADPLEEDAIWMFLNEFKRIEAPGLQPYPLEEACGRMLHALGLAAPGEATLTPTPQSDESMDDLLAQGKAQFAQGRYAEALPFFERASERDPQSIDAWTNLGLIYDITGRHSDSLAAFERALTLDPNNPSLWSYKGLALDALERFAEALDAYEKSLALDPNDATTWMNKGNALGSQGRFEEALAAHDKALAINPNDAKAWSNRGLALGFSIASQKHWMHMSEQWLSILPTHKRGATRALHSMI